MLDEFSKALDESDAAEAARLIFQQEFVLIELPNESDEEGYAAVTAEVDGQPALIAFTSGDHAGVFVGSIPEVAGEDGDVPGIVVDGRELLEYLSEGLGLLLNPETDDSYFLRPEFIEEIEAALGERE